MIRWSFVIEVGDAEPGMADINEHVEHLREYLIGMSVTHTFTDERAPAKTGRITLGYPTPTWPLENQTDA